MSHVHVCSSSRRRWHAALHGDSGSHRGDKRSGIPPHAGKTYLCSIELALRWDHPRVCGENITKVKLGATIAGSPPRVRGKLHPAHQLPVPAGITPAHAGKTPAPSRNSLTGRDHPRVCGENAYASCAPGSYQGSPPRVRGKYNGGIVNNTATGITPACAGKMHSRPRRSYPARDHPRVCGENDDSYPRAHVRLGSPPRVRGKSLFALVKTVEGRITPACAGKILTTPAIRCPIVDHPRVCGENMGGASKKEASPGSPPRVRGKWDGDYMDKRSFGITPACAGKIRRA